jgi:hypothetical protein
MPSTADSSRETALRIPVGHDDTGALEVIDRAARKVVRDFGDDELDQSDADVLERETETVAAAIREAVRGRIPDLGATGVVDRLRLLRRLRMVVVHFLDGDVATMVSVLGAI